MSLVLMMVTFIDFILALMVLGGSIQLIKRHDRLRHHHYIFRKRLRILRHFKALYGSYKRYRSSFGLGIETVFKEEYITQLIQNDYLGHDVSFMAKITSQEGYLILKEKITQLDLLSEDLQILYNGNEAQLLQDFIFWYRLLLSELGSQIHQSHLEKVLDPLHTCSMHAEVKNLERCYQNLEESQLLESLERKLKLKV